MACSLGFEVSGIESSETIANQWTVTLDEIEIGGDFYLVLRSCDYNR